METDTRKKTSPSSAIANPHISNWAFGPFFLAVLIPLFSKKAKIPLSVFLSL